jgi:3-methylcrotonyl-CoA carboxylase alpha subunit
MKVNTIAPGVYRVDDGTRRWTVAVAGPAENRWIWVDGHVVTLAPPATGRSRVRSSRHELSAPMPATVVKVLVEVGARVKRGDTVLMLEAMKMELPIRAPHDGHVTAVNCEAGELVQPGVELMILSTDGAAGSAEEGHA